jgi:ABC-2 type transport system permease protein
MSAMAAPASVVTAAPATPAATPAPPPAWEQSLILARYQLREYLRSARFVLMMGIVAAAGLIITSLLAYFRPDGISSSPVATYAGPWGGGVTFVIVIAGIIYGGDAIAGEFQNRTGYFLMGLPLRRASVYAGKYLAAFTASTVAVVFYLVVMVENAAFYTGTSAFTDLGPLFASLALALLYESALLGTVFLFSSLFKQSLYGVVVVAVLFLFGWTLLETELVALAHIEPWFVISYAAPIIGFPFSSTLPPHTIHGPNGVTLYNPTMVEGIAILLGYFLLTSLAGLVLFEREEFT